MKNPLLAFLPVAVLALIVIPSFVAAQVPGSNPGAGFMLQSGGLLVYQTPLVHIADSGDFIAIHYGHAPDLFVYAPDGSLLWNRTFAGERPPWVSSLSIAPDDRFLLATRLVPGCCHGEVTNTSSNSAILLARNGSIAWEYPVGNPPLASAVAGSGEIIVGTAEGRILFLAPDGTLDRTAKPGFPVTSLAVSRDGSTIIATAEPSDSEDLYAFARDGSLLWKYRTRGRNSAAVSDNGSVIAVITRLPAYDLLVFNRSGGVMARQSIRETAAGIAVTGDGSRIIVANGSSVSVLGNSGNLLESYPAGGTIQSLAATPDGRMIAVVTGRDVIEIQRSTDTATAGVTGVSTATTTARSVPTKATGWIIVPVIAVAVAGLMVLGRWHRSDV